MVEKQHATQDKMSYVQAAVYTSLAPATLSAYRARGIGPEAEYTKTGLVSTKEALDAWLATRKAR
jgi:hypothetical protein